jgi:hypothetical protein
MSGSVVKSRNIPMVLDFGFTLAVINRTIDHHMAAEKPEQSP